VFVLIASVCFLENQAMGIVGAASAIQAAANQLHIPLGYACSQANAIRIQNALPMFYRNGLITIGYIMEVVAASRGGYLPVSPDANLSIGLRKCGYNVNCHGGDNGVCTDDYGTCWYVQNNMTPYGPQYTS